MLRTTRVSHVAPCVRILRTVQASTRPILALVLCGFLTIPPGDAQETAPVPKPSENPPILLLDGTPIKLRMNRTMSSADASVGQPVDFTVTEEVVVDGSTVIPQGSAAMGKVTEAQAKRRMGRAGKLEIVLTYVRLADTETVPIRAVKEVKGKNAAVGMTVGIVATGVLFFPAAPLFLLMKGKDITVPEGAQVIAYVDQDHKLEAMKFLPKPAPAAAGTTPGSATSTVPAPVDLATTYPPTTAPETTGVVEVVSNPPAASVLVDGTFMANAPVTLHLNPGQHSIRLQLEGYREWAKDVTVDAGTPNHVTADLEKSN